MDLQHVARSAPGLLRGARYGRRVSLGRGTRIRLTHGSVDMRRCALGANVQIAVTGTAESPARLSIGRGTFVSDRCIINVASSIRIGEYSGISWNCQVLDTDFHQIVYADGSAPLPVAPVVIGDHVLVGTSSLILKGVHIGNGAIVAAGSVVTRDVDAGWLVAGNPARPIRQVSHWVM